MLLQFTVENFLSFNEKQVFSMRASRDKDHPRHVIDGKTPVVRGAAVYGANAAGKSNLVLAMAFAQDLIVLKKSSASIADIRTFRRGNGEQRNSSFHWHFAHGAKIWSYGFDLNAHHIADEYLYVRDEDGGREKKCFERLTSESGKTSISLNETFFGRQAADDAQLAKLIGPRTPKDKLFLRHCLDNEILAVQPILEWFHEVLLIVKADSPYQPLVLEAHENDSFLQFLSHHMKDSGTGITEILKYATKIDVDKELRASQAKLSTPEGGNLSRLQIILETLDVGQSTFLDYSAGGHTAIFQRNENGVSSKAILSRHTSADGSTYFNFEEESEGTQRLLHLLPHLYRLQTRPTVLVIDELERRLHTLLTRRLVDQALNVTPIERSQFIFTTHDTNLLDSNLLRRDEIWFVDKNEQGASTLTSLAEYKIRPDVDYEKGYLLGRFDGIPYFRHSGELSEALQEDK